MYNRTCYIIEEDQRDLEILLSFISKVPYLTVAGTTTNFSEGFPYLITNSVDILFLNLGEDSGGGLNAYDVLKTIPNLPQTIVTSKKEEFAVHAFNVGIPVDFLLKPFDCNRFLIAVHRAISVNSISNQVLKKGQFYFFKVGRKYQRVDLDMVLYFEAFGIYTKIFSEVNKRPLIINENITSVMENLSRSTFVRVHKSYIVNIDHITSFDIKNVYIDTFPVPIGGAYKTKLDNIKKSISSFEEVA
jgi:DNA-binding LytR/AlgR family response regulator